MCIKVNKILYKLLIYKIKMATNFKMATKILIICGLDIVINMRSCHLTVMMTVSSTLMTVSSTSVVIAVTVVTALYSQA